MQEPAIKVIAMPADTNPDGDMFGGWIMSQMDLAGYLAARKIAQGKVVTVAMDKIVFHNPVFVGDCLECYASVEKIGKTSIAIKVEAYVERKNSPIGAAKEKVTEGTFIFVAIDSQRKPRKVPIT
jgi:acyl-CoA thioesterase YciA